MFIDAENLNYSLMGPALNEILKYGIISGTRAYADWSNQAYKNWPDILDKHGIRPMQQFHYDKDETDKAIIMDVMEVVYSNSNINAICIIANDHIYGSIARRVREKGKYFLGIGTKSASQKFVKACNSFVYTDNIVQNAVGINSSIKVVKDSGIKKLIIQAMDEIGEDTVHLATLGAMLKKLDPAFDPRTYGHKKLLGLIDEYQDIVKVQHDDRTPPVYYVELKG